MTQTNWPPVNPGRFSIPSIEARIRLAQKNFGEALRELQKGGLTTPQDQLLRARILEVQAADMTTPFSQRDELRQQAAIIRAQHQMLNEFEVER